MVIISILRGILILCILIISYIVRYIIKFKLNKKYRRAKENITYNSDKKFYFTKKLFDKAHIQKKLIRCGNPLKLNASRYIFTKVAVAVVMLIVLLQQIGISIKGFIFSGAVSVLGFFLVDIINYISNEDDKNKIRMDLADVYDLVTLQTVAGVSIGHALLEAYTVCKNSRFKKSLIRLAARINLSKNIEKALDNFNEEYDMPEIDSFVALIKESISSGISEDALDDQSASLKAINSIYTASQTEKIDMYVLAISMMLLSGIVMLVYYVIGSTMMQSVHGIFN